MPIDDKNADALVSKLKDLKLKKDMKLDEHGNNEEKIPRYIQILIQLTLWALEKKYKELTLDDISIILLKMTAEKDAIAEIFFNTLSPKEQAQLIDALLRREVARVVKEENWTTFMRSNTILSALMNKQRIGFDFGYTLLDLLPQHIRKFQVVYRVRDKESLVRDELYPKLLRDFLKSLPDELEQLPNAIKYNCHLIAKNLLNAQFEEQKIFSMIGNYIFLRYVTVSMMLYVKSEAFKTKHQSRTKLSKTNSIIEENIFAICAKVVQDCMTSPLQMLSNGISKEDPDNPDMLVEEPVVMIRTRADDWRQKAYEIAYGFKSDLKKSLRKLARSKSVELSADSPQNLEAKLKISTSKSIEWDTNSIVDNYIRKFPDSGSLLQFINSSETKQDFNLAPVIQGTDEHFQKKTIETADDDSGDEVSSKDCINFR